MARFDPISDPYRVLGVLRGATAEQIKAAHRQLAKRYHPDGGAGDAARFLEVQEAYLLLSDPLRRRDWDRAHAPGPVRGTTAPRRKAGAAAGSETEPRRRTARAARPRRAGASSTRTWSAEGVPWWEDFRPGQRARTETDGTPGGDADAGDAAADSAAADDATQPQPPLGSAGDEFDVFDRSSGAAWSAAARRHFRRGTDDLPSRGVWRYRGTQVVTGAEARRAAAEEEEERPRR